MNKPASGPSEAQTAPVVPGAGPAANAGPPEDAEDRELVARAVRGDAQAFEALFLKYRQRLFAVAHRMLRSEDAALDVVQDAFVRAYEQLAKLRAEGRFYPWLRRTAINLCIDRLRHSRRGVELGFDEGQFGEGDEADPERMAVARDERAERESPERKAELSEFSAALQKALDQLSAAHRTTFLLHAAEGLSYREIAETMGCQIGTVMSRLFYARKQLQELLGPHLEGGGEDEP